MENLIDAAVVGLEALIRWLRIIRHQACCQRPIRWVTHLSGRLVIDRCDECAIERALIEKGWYSHASHP